MALQPFWFIGLDQTALCDGAFGGTAKKIVIWALVAGSFGLWLSLFVCGRAVVVPFSCGKAMARAQWGQGKPRRGKSTVIWLGASKHGKGTSRAR